VAVIEVVAVITVDPKLPPTRTAPVTSTITVKKGLKEVVMEVGGGGFGCGDCGSPYYYSGFIVPVLKKAVSYRAVFTGFGYGPCNRTVTWAAPKGDGGGCNFPITYHPFTLAGTKTDLWALWMGHSGDPLGWDAGGGRCVVTISLAP